ncbi:hypothetical protein BCR36DRAFT_245993, partial [Piromyces finnis]
CSGDVIRLGYLCCSLPCTVIYTDDDGDWAFQNNEWCGCGGDFRSSQKCPPEVFYKGYNCCRTCHYDSEIEKEDGIKWAWEDGRRCGV